MRRRPASERRCTRRSASVTCRSKSPAHGSEPRASSRPCRSPGAPMAPGRRLPLAGAARAGAAGPRGGPAGWFCAGGGPQVCAEPRARGDVLLDRMYLQMRAIITSLSSQEHDSQSPRGGSKKGDPTM